MFYCLPSLLFDLERDYGGGARGGEGTGGGSFITQRDALCGFCWCLDVRSAIFIQRIGCSFKELAIVIVKDFRGGELT